MFKNIFGAKLVATFSATFSRVTIKMPKRQCPFEEDYIPQSKVHLTKKGYERTSTKAMENIWNKTRDLLFEGAKRSAVEKQITTGCKERCDYCQNCFESLNDCRLCHGFYCADCSMISYKDNLNEYICLSCA